MNRRTVSSLKLKSDRAKKTRNKKTWRYQFAYKQYVGGRIVANLATYDLIEKPINENPINEINLPINLREAIKIYSEYANLFGYKKAKLTFTDNFGYYVMLMHYENEMSRLIEYNEAPNIIYGVSAFSPNTKSALKVLSLLRELVRMQDIYSNGLNKNIRTTIIEKRKSIESVLNKWLSELSNIDGISAEQRLNQIKTHGRSRIKLKKAN